MAKILVVEDDPASLMLMTEILSKSGYSVISATDGQAAIDMAVANNPDLAIVDVMLPVLNGYQVCETLRAMPRFQRLPVMILTVLNEDQHRIRATEAGAIDFLSKPFKRIELLTKIRAILALHQDNAALVPLDTVCLSWLQALGQYSPTLKTSALRSAYYAERVGLVQGLDSHTLTVLRYGMLLRDIGCLTIPSENPNYGEEDVLHAVRGAEIAEKFAADDVCTIVRYHSTPLTDPSFPKNLSEFTTHLLNIALSASRFDYLQKRCSSLASGSAAKCFAEEVSVGMWPKTESDLLLDFCRQL